jgi:high-affinity iron transporter
MKLRPLPAGVLLMWLVSSACRNVDTDLPRAYRAVPVPASLASADAVRRGGALFHQYCTLCHGVRGDGHGLQSEGLTPPPRDLTDPNWRQGTSPRHVFFAIREGVRGTAMPSWKSLSESDGWDLTAYVLSLSSR